MCEKNQTNLCLLHVQFINFNLRKHLPYASICTLHYIPIWHVELEPDTPQKKKKKRKRKKNQNVNTCLHLFIATAATVTFTFTSNNQNRFPGNTFEHTSTSEISILTIVNN